MFKKKEFVTVVFSRDTKDIVTAGTVLMVVTGDRDTVYWDNYKYPNQHFIRTKCTKLRYWIAKIFANIYVPDLCGFNCPEEGLL